MFPFTREKLKEWAGPDAFRRAEMLVENHRVHQLKPSAERLEGVIESRPRDILCAVNFPKKFSVT